MLEEPVVRVDSLKGNCKKNSLGFTDLKKFLRHKHPMIFLDRIVDYKPKEFVHALLAISGNMDCIDGHFPERAIFPGTNLLQSFCQAAIILFQLSTSKLENDEMAIVSSINTKFLKVIVPGDTVNIHVAVEYLYDNSLIFSGKAFVNDVRVATVKSSIIRTKISNIGTELW